MPVTDTLNARHTDRAAPHACASAKEALKRMRGIATQCATDVIDRLEPPRNDVSLSEYRTAISPKSAPLMICW